jgi:hypothetical protein
MKLDAMRSGPSSFLAFNRALRGTPLALDLAFRGVALRHSCVVVYDILGTYPGTQVGIRTPLEGCEQGLRNVVHGGGHV